MVYAIKIARDSQIAFAVEAVAASQVRDVAQQVRYWQGRVFLPVLHGVGLGRIADTSLHRVTQKPAMLVMELADGTLQGKKFEGEALMMVAWALASTLALLNSSGFIHGDLKPSNVLWQACSDGMEEQMLPGLNGWPLLTDFGSAQAFRTMHPQQTPLDLNDKVQTHGWTKAYAAPEVVSCHGQWQTIRSDMFSWALTIRAVSQDGDLPPTLQDLCTACLNSDPERRPSSFGEIAERLEKECPACLQWGMRLWQHQQRYFESAAHAQQHSSNLCKQGLHVLVSHRQQILGDRKHEADALELLAEQCHRIGNATDAVKLRQEAVKVDPQRAASVVSLGNLGNSYGELGDAAKQRDLLERALKIEEAYFGEDHREVAITLTNLGCAYGALGDALKKRDLLKRALKIDEAYFGEDHREVAITLTGLANAYGDLGDTAKKRGLLERALKILEAYFGEDHREVAITLTNLGNAYGNLGDALKERDLLERALKILEAYFGKDHKELAITLANLGNAYGDLGDALKKRDLLERALKILEAYFGEDHKEVAITLANLGNAYGDLGDALKKRDLLERALKIREAYFGKDHKEVAIALADLGNAYGDLGDALKERDLLERALKILEAYFGEDHKELAITLGNLGNAYGDLGDALKKRDLLERALKIKEAHFGEDHKEVAFTLANLGPAYGNLGDALKESDLLERALKILEAYFGKDHKEVAITLANLGMNSRHILQGYEVARESCERALKIFLKTWDSEHPYAVKVQRHLGDVLQKHEACAYSFQSASESHLQCALCFSLCFLCFFSLHLLACMGLVALVVRKLVLLTRCFT